LFSASHQEKVFPKREKSFVTANFKYFFSQKKMDSKTFQEGVSELKRITGLWDTLEFNLPEHKLGYAKIEFDAMISSKGTKQLLASNLEGTSVESIQEKIENYFDHESSPAKVCGFYRKVKFCKAHILSTTSQALGKMGKKIEEMKKWYSQKNWKKYTESFAEFGQEAITNQFTFNTFLKMLGKDNFKMQFKISGEKLKVLSINNFEENLSLN
jgi:hypothetical protein